MIKNKTFKIENKKLIKIKTKKRMINYKLMKKVLLNYKTIVLLKMINGGTKKEEMILKSICKCKTNYGTSISSKMRRKKGKV